MVLIDPTVSIEGSVGKFIMIAGVDPATQKPFVFQLDPTTGAIPVSAVASSGGLPTAGVNGAVTAGAVAAPLQAASFPLTQGVLVQNPIGSAGPAEIGFAGVTVGTGVELQPGDAAFAVIDDVNKVMVISSGTPTLRYMGS